MWGGICCREGERDRGQMVCGALIVYKPCHSPSENPPEGSGCLPRGCSAHCWWRPSLLEAAHIHTHKQHECMHACIRETEVLQSHKKKYSLLPNLPIQNNMPPSWQRRHTGSWEKFETDFYTQITRAEERFLPFLQKKTNLPASLSYIIQPLKTARPSSKVKNPFPHIPTLHKTLGNPKNTKKTRRENKRERSTWIKFLGNKTKPTKKGKKERNQEKKNSD